MKGSFNFEFGEGDLRRFVEDIGRRWTLNTIHDVLKHLRDPHLSQLIKEALRTGIAAGRSVGRRGRPREPVAEYEEVFDVGTQAPWGPPPPWGPGVPPPYQSPFGGAPAPPPFVGSPYYPQPGAPPPFHGAPSPFSGHGGIAEEILRGPGGEGPSELSHCVPVEASQYQEEGWLCHECRFVNVAQRSVCRHCKHERCDDIVAPEGAKGTAPS